MSSELQTRPWLPWLLVFVKPLAIYNGYRAHRHTPHVKPTVIREMQNIILQGLMLEAKSYGKISANSTRITII
jgi:hypothetical protein